MKLPILKNGKLEDYLVLKNQGKVCLSESILLMEKGNKVDTNIGYAEVLLPDLPDEVVSFTVSQRKDKRKYWLNFRSLEMCEAPCYKFDSDGASHENRYDDIPLPQRVVPTPHFQFFDDAGRWFAYRTAHLNDKKAELLLRTSLDEGVKHFCEVARLRTRGGNIPSANYDQPGLDIQHDDDPLNGVNFS